ncbi:MAG TPA: enolase C-terminal domain-like protein [Candidatus Deferrimicrobium sp.]|nr:enolase C-terminal domain-like protein [Candidatus Deferrimicrobium sp.]
MIELQTVKVSIPLKKKFAVAKGSAEVKTNLLTILNNRYFGEASGSVHAGPSVAEIEAGVIKGMKYLRKYREITPEILREIGSWDIPRAAQSALMAMIVNYISGETGRYPWEILSLGTPVGIRSSFTIGLADPAEMIQSIKLSDYPIIKIKMGTDDDTRLLDMLTEVTGKEIRVDANGGWTCAKAEEMIFHLAKRGVTVVEQPTEAESVKEWPHLKGNNEHVQLIMDEGVNVAEDYRMHAQHIDGVNIKMEKCGGIIEGVRLAQQARKDNKKVMLGCMVESSVGIAQSVYMSAYADYFDLDGPLLLESDIASGIHYDREEIGVDREIIGGPKLRREVVEKYICE